MTATPTGEIRKGLAGVIADQSGISKVNPETNSLLYRGYPVQDLAARVSFEEVAYLLWHGELPTSAQLDEQTKAERAARALPENVKAAILELPTECHPMDVCRTAVSLLGAHDPQAEDSSVDAELGKALRLWAVMPSVVALDQRRRRGQEIVPPREDLGYSANFLWMTFGEEADPAVVKAFEASMVLYAEHSFNASTFTARVITSTLADLHSAVTGAIGALKGPLHGGANEAVQETFEEIGTADRAVAWLDDALASKRKIMGFGHRVYKKGDSRVPTMRAVLGDMVEHYGKHEVLDLYDALEQAMGERKGIKPNLDYPAGPAYHLMGFDTNIFTPLFVASRITGWTAHIMEQRASNALIRPVCEYNGPDERQVP
ncbi:bifunctional 2-methylcitrate synthase/citrate synthase [Myceligenerans salitolerans]|uniref:Citrate synthase n=1 Tax=Myceligenerans salitolerans TaxID=1230528 RepID=A0ABS3IDC4_9MICO|nr:bifunctional 2-methylcitrate synthase/citrate synthase [Myceligenerans salitolerans]MBO0611032.1 bifunctional 2-methylcitrate synthase/citrate synthase [Myceligenerans salitolerans]